MTYAFSIAFFAAIYVVGTIASKKTKGRIGTTLISLFVFLIGFWSGLLPKDIGTISNITAVYQIVSSMIITNVAASVELSQLKRYWKLVIACIFGLVGLTLFELVGGSLLFGFDFAIAMYPTLTGGAQATRIMSEALNARNLTTLAGLVVLINSMQSWFGIPMITQGVRTECTALLSKYRSGEISFDASGTASSASNKNKKVPLISRIPAKYDMPWIHLMILALLSGIGNYVGGILGPMTYGIFGNTVMCLILGIIGRSTGILAANPMAKAGVFQFFMFSQLIGLRCNLASVSLMDVVSNFIPMVALILLGGVGIYLFGTTAGKVMKQNKGITMAATFGAYLGYPLNYQLAQEIIESITDDKTERALLEDRILSRVFIGSLVSVTILSLIIASVVSQII